jgi:hypothetical protein
MKTIMFLITLILICGFLLGVASCDGIGGGFSFDFSKYKTTGGGWFYNNGDSTKMVTFGFNTQPAGPTNADGQAAAKGQFELIDHKTNTNIHGTFDTIYVTGDPTSNTTAFSGTCTCTINNQKKIVPFGVGFTDNGQLGVNPGDYISVDIDIQADSNTDNDLKYSGTLGGGNIQIHQK